jgi:hypothetical protein
MQGLVALSAWLAEARVTHVAMEATGVYWKPVWRVLRHDFSLALANASRAFATRQAARAPNESEPSDTTSRSKDRVMTHVSGERRRSPEI